MCPASSRSGRSESRSPLSTAARRRMTRTRSRTGIRRSAYLLLETLIATAFLVLGLAVIGSQVQRAYFSRQEIQRQYRALMLAESKLAEIDTGILEIDSFDEETEEEFGPLFPHFAYRLRLQPTVTPGLNQVRLQILHQIRDYDREPFDFDTADVLYELYTFRTEPRTVDFEADFGMDPERVEELGDLFAAAGVPIDPNDFGLQEFMRSADTEQLLALLSNQDLLNSLGIRQEQLLSALPPDLVRELQGRGEGGRGDGGRDGAGGRDDGGRNGGGRGNNDDDDEDDDE